MKTIDTEHHFVTPLYMETLRGRTTTPRIDEARGLGYWEDAWIPIGQTGAGPKLADMGEGRLRAMDEAGVDFAVLSLTAPGVEPLEPPVATRLARDANDRLAEYVAAYPDRLAGMATLSPKEPEEAVRELERCVKELGFKGWHTHSNFGDSYVDEKRYWPILAKAEELGRSHLSAPDLAHDPRAAQLRYLSGRSHVRVRDRGDVCVPAHDPSGRVR